MNRIGLALANKYAEAYLNTFGSQMDVETAVGVKKLAGVLERDKRVIGLLKLPILDWHAKADFLIRVCKKKVSLPGLDRLLELLGLAKRLALFPKILASISAKYLERRGVISFEISSSEPLDEAAMSTVAKFLESRSGRKVMLSSRVDTNLLAGIRVLGGWFLWEYSVESRLRQLKNLTR